MRYSGFAVLGLLFSMTSIANADPCPLVSVSLPASRTGTVPNTCFDYGVVAGNAYVDYVVIYEFTVQPGRTIGATMHTEVQQPLLFLLDSGLNPLAADIGSATDAEVAFPQAIGGTYYLEVGVPGDQVGASFTVEITGASAPPLISHKTAKNIESEYPSDPIDPTNYFSPSDNSAWSWLEVGPITGIHQIEWQFIEPDGRDTVYFDATTVIGDAGAHDWWKAWDGIYIKGYLPATMLGAWRVDVKIDGVAAFSDLFTVSNSPPPCVQGRDPRCGVRIIVPKPRRPRS